MGGTLGPEVTARPGLRISSSDPSSAVQVCPHTKDVSDTSGASYDSTVHPEMVSDRVRAPSHQTAPTPNTCLSSLAPGLLTGYQSDVPTKPHSGLVRLQEPLSELRGNAFLAGSPAWKERMERRKRQAEEMLRARYGTGHRACRPYLGIRLPASPHDPQPRSSPLGFYGGFITEA